MKATIYPIWGQCPHKTSGVPATIRDATGHPVDVFALDLSHTGFLIATDHKLRVGQPFSIGIGGLGMHQGVVDCVSKNVYGCHFVEPVGHFEVERAGTDTMIALPLQYADGFKRENRLPIRMRVAIICFAALFIWLLLVATVYLVILLL